MSRTTSTVIVLSAIALGTIGCTQSPPPDTPRPVEGPASHAVFAELARDSNKLMKNGLNRRVFNTTEAQAGTDITLGSDGIITLEPGTYRITGFSFVSMQTTFAPPTITHDNNYPSYAIVYPKSVETAGRDMLKQAIAIGSPQTAQYMAPSLFDAIYTATARTEIAVGHQSGDDLHDEVYLSVYEVDGTKSDYHVVARVTIIKM